MHFTDECVKKWREQQYYVANSIAGVIAEPTVLFKKDEMDGFDIDIT